jgi:type III restriction enzyme
MSLQFRIADQVLKVNDTRIATERVVHKYDAFLNILCADQFAFQRDAVRETVRFLVSDRYKDLEGLARENWNARPAIQIRHDNLDAYLDRMALRNLKSVSIDLATGTGKSYVMYALAAIALAEGLADRVLVLCPSVTIEAGLIRKFTALAGEGELSALMQELGALVSIPAIKKGNETIRVGDICVENIHAVYENTGSSIRDSFRGTGLRTLVLNDEAHHLFSQPDKAAKEWLKFLQNPDFGFRQIVNVTGTPYIDDEYFPDVVFRYGIKQAIADHVVKKPNYKLEDTYSAHDWARTYAIHEKNRKTYGHRVKPLSIIVTQEIARCVEVWRELIEFLAKKEKLSLEKAASKVIWVTSGAPDKKTEPGKRVLAAYLPRNDNDSPEKVRGDNLFKLSEVDESNSPVEWIVSVSMLTEGWDVKNVFQIVPHESRAFSSKLLIAQVLGRGLRVPPGLETDAMVTINNHEAWSDQIGNLLKEVLEVENTLTWGHDPRRKRFVFPLHNIQYATKQTTIETKRERAKEPAVVFLPQARRTVEYSTFSETGKLAVEIEHHGTIEIEDAARVMRLFLKEKDEALAGLWPKTRVRKLIVDKLASAGQDFSFISKENLIRLQQSFGPMFRELGQEHPRMSQIAQGMVQVNVAEVTRQTFSESMLKEDGALYFVEGDTEAFAGHEVHLWEQYLKFQQMVRDYGDDASDQAKSIASRIRVVKADAFKTPWNIHYASHEPEREFSDLLFHNHSLFDAFLKMPNVGCYAFPYSYKPASAAKTHVSNENFNPDFFLKVAGGGDILVVEIKSDGDDSNRNRAKCRDGLRHFDSLNRFLQEAAETWRYHFYFLTPADFTAFFQKVRESNYIGWRSALMQELVD